MSDDTPACLYCGNIFKRNKPKQRFCSRKCGTVFANKARTGEQRPLTPRVCIVCGVQILGQRASKKLCSSRCRQDKSRADRGLPNPERLREKGVKRCLRCESVKPLEDFYYVKTRGSYFSWCKPCRLECERVANRRRRGLPDDAPTRDLKKRHLPDGTKRPEKSGYVLEKRLGHHRADRSGWVFQHILVAEEKYGFPITRAFTVHHKNGVRDDNRSENLELRVGNHGKGGDLIPSILAKPNLRDRAVEVLREYGYEVTAPWDRRND